MEKKEHLRTKIDRLRKIETMMQEDLFIRETMLVPPMAELGLRSHTESFYENP